MVVSEALKRERGLSKLADTLNALGLRAAVAQRRQKQRGQDRDYGYDTEQFEQCKRPGFEFVRDSHDALKDRLASGMPSGISPKNPRAVPARCASLTHFA